MTPSEILGIRAQLNLTQAELACKIGVSRTNIRAWENGDYQPSKMRQERLRQLLNIHIKKEKDAKIV